LTTLNPNPESEEKIMKRNASIPIAIALLVLCLPLIPSPAFAQETGLLASKDKVSSAATEQKPAVTYRIEFNVREIEGAKRLNSRDYMVVTQSRQHGRIRVGNKVPLVMPNQNFQYQDVGLNIDCTPREVADGIDLEISFVSTSFVMPEDSAAPSHAVLREQRSSVEPVVALGKPTLVTTMDDVTSNRRFEIEVTATKLK
jgi:hypothetical protein